MENIELEKTWVNVNMSKDLDLQVRRAAAEKRISRSEFVRQAIKNYLNQQHKATNNLKAA